MNAHAEYSDAVPIGLESARTLIGLASELDVPAVVDFYTRNRERFESVDPERPPLFYDERFWRAQVRQSREDLAADRALRLFVFTRQEHGRVIGNVGLSNFVRGIGQSCTLGYSLDAEWEGRGVMTEVLRVVIDHAFGPLHFHRIEANYMPRNERSGALLRRMGFVVEGYSHDYLRINGRWRDHIRTALTNPNWRE